MFLNTFAKRPLPVNEQVRIIGDFLNVRLYASSHLLIADFPD
jgi:hypothetical protein